MQEDFYDLLGIAKNSTDYEIYRAFTGIMSGNDSFDELTKKKYIEAFIVLSDINLRIKYDLSLGLNYGDEIPWYHYTYFENGWNFFDINGNLGGDKGLTKLIETIKGSPIRSSVSQDAFISEYELLKELVSYTKKRMENNDYESFIYTKKDCIDLSDEEKFNFFKSIYEKYKRGFTFSQDFAQLVSSWDYNLMDIEDATKMSAQQLLISKKGVCTHFASLIHEELKGVGLESHFLRMGLPHWYHHIVLYRVNQDWKICDLTNEYLFGGAGYKTANKDYLSIPLQEFIKNNRIALYTCVIPKLAGDDILKENSISLREFIESKSNNELHDYKLK